MKQSSAVAQLRQVCSLGLDAEAAMPAVLKSLRQLVHCDSAGFFWVDDRGDMADLYAERMLPPHLMRAYFDRYYDGADHRFRERFLERVRRGEHVSSSTPDLEVERTAYYNEILKPLDAHHILYAIVLDNGSALGQLSLYRNRRSAAFGAADRRAIEGVTRYLAHALALRRERVADRVPSYRDSDFEALVICDRRGHVRYASPLAYGLLARASGKAINRRTVREEIDGATRELLVKMGGMVDRQANGSADEPPRLTVDNRWGRFRLRAYSLGAPGDGATEIGVLIQQQEHFLVQFAESMRKLPISPQQRQVALLLAQGTSNAEIATRLGVSLNTASYHVKQLFQKLDAHDRASAVARIEAAGVNGMGR